MHVKNLNRSKVSIVYNPLYCYVRESKNKQNPPDYN
jgi:hypothetical protein